MEPIYLGDLVSSITAYRMVMGKYEEGIKEGRIL